jgi:HlyD family secretion protein
MMDSAPSLVASNPVTEHLNEASLLIRRGIFVLLAGVLPIAMWMTFAPISSAVVAPAFVKVDLNRRPVQHAEGGTVRKVYVRDGQHVRFGQPLLALGDISVDADKNRIDYRVQTEHASIARLDAEQMMARTISFPPELLAIAQSDVRLAKQLEKESALFFARRDTLQGQVRLLKVQRDKVAEEIVALRAQIDQAKDSIRFQKADLENNRKLLNEGFISATRIAQIEGIVADYGVKIEERRSELARAQQRTVDADLRIRSLESEYRQQASDQLKVTAARLSEIEQEQRKAGDASARQVITAPTDGEIIGLKYTTAGAVIPPRDTIADIVPKESRLVTEARIRTEDISRVQLGSAAEIRFSAFQYRTTKLMPGKIIYISGDRLVDPSSNLAYYSVLIEADQNSLARAGDLKLLAGMPAEVYIKGGERTAIEYLVEPITQVLRRAARER